MKTEYLVQEAAKAAGIHVERVRQLLKDMREDWHYRVVGKTKIINSRGMKVILERPNQRKRKTK